MKNTNNYNLPLFESGDKFNKETINETNAKIDLAISDLQETFNASATTGGLTTQEVINARKGKESLKDKIDEIDVITQNNKTQLDSNMIETSKKLTISNKISDSLGVKFVAHRGVSSIAPENSIPAFILACELGYWGIETDVCMTSDNEWVIMHDETVDRTTNGIGKVSELTLTQIQGFTIDYGNNIANYPNLKVPTLIDFLRICRDYDVVPNIEVKFYKSLDDFESLVKLLKDYGYEHKAIISSFDINALKKIKSIDNKISVLPSVDLRQYGNIALCEELGNTLIGGYNNQLINPTHPDNWLRVYKEKGISVVGYYFPPNGDNYLELNQAIDYGIDYYNTDKLLPLTPFRTNFASRLINVNTKQGFKTNISNLLTSFSYVDGTPSNNQFTFANGKAWAKSSVGVYGCFSIPIYNTNIGDVVDIEVKLKNITGKCNVYVDEIHSTGAGVGNVNTYYSKETNEWQTIRYRHLCENKTYNNVAVRVGVPTNLEGEFEVEYIAINHYSKKLNSEKQFKNFYIRKNSTSSAWELHPNVCNDGANISELDSTTLQVTYDEEYKTHLSPVVIIGADGIVSSYKYRPVVLYSNKQGVQVKFVKQDGTYATLSAIEGNTMFGIIVCG